MDEWCDKKQEGLSGLSPSRTAVLPFRSLLSDNRFSSATSIVFSGESRTGRVNSVVVFILIVIC